MVKNSPAVQEILEAWVQSLDWKDPLEEGMATHSSILAWRIPWTEEPRLLTTWGMQRVRQDWVTERTCWVLALLKDVICWESPLLRSQILLVRTHRVCVPLQTSQRMTVAPETLPRSTVPAITSTHRPLSSALSARLSLKLYFWIFSFCSCTYLDVMLEFCI